VLESCLESRPSLITTYKSSLPRTGFISGPLFNPQTVSLDGYECLESDEPAPVLPCKFDEIHGNQCLNSMAADPL